MPKKIGILAAYFAATIIFIFGAFAPIHSHDLFWHLRIGEDLLFHALNPFVDHYSFTMPGARVHSLTLPFDCIVALIYKFFGFWGIKTFRFAVWVLGFLLLDRILVYEDVDILLRMFALGLFVFAATSRTQTRPEILSVPLEMWTIMLVRQWQLTPSWKKTFGLFALMLIWTNMHGDSSAFGYAIIGAFMAESALLAARRSDKKVCQFAIASCLVVLAAGFLNPDFSHPLLEPFTFNPLWQKYISEFVPISFYNLPKVLRAFFALVVIALPGLLLANQFGAALLISVLAYETLKFDKVLMHAIPISAPFIAISLQHYLDWIKGRDEQKAFALSKIALAAIVIFTYYSAYNFVRIPLRSLYNSKIDKEVFPFATVNYMKRKKLTGNVFDYYDYGGYVLYNLAPRIKVYIDGRTNTLYPISLFSRFLTASDYPGYLAHETHRYHIKYVLSPFAITPISNSAIQSGLFSLDYVGFTSNLFIRGKTGRFRHIQYMLYHPQCVLDHSDARLKSEEELIRKKLPPYSALRTYVDLIKIYQKSSDKQKLLSTIHPSWNYSIPMDRLAANLAGRQKLWKVKLYYLDEIGNQFMLATDLLNRAETLCKIGHCDLAQTDLYVAFHKVLRNDQKFKLASILAQVEASGPLTVFPKAAAARVEHFVKGFTKKYGRPKKPDFCEHS